MAKKPKSGYVLWYRTPVRGLGGRVVKYTMLSRSGVVTMEMAQALTGDISKLDIYWEIRKSPGDEVVETSEAGDEKRKEHHSVSESGQGNPVC